MQDWGDSDGSASDDSDDEDDDSDDGGDDSGDGGTDGDDCACGGCTSDDEDDSERGDADALSNRQPADGGDDAAAAMVRACVHGDGAGSRVHG